MSTRTITANDRYKSVHPARRVLVLPASGSPEFATIRTDHRALADLLGGDTERAAVPGSGAVLYWLANGPPLGLPENRRAAELAQQLGAVAIQVFGDLVVVGNAADGWAGDVDEEIARMASRLSG